MSGSRGVFIGQDKKNKETLICQDNFRKIWHGKFARRDINFLRAVTVPPARSVKSRINPKTAFYHYSLRPRGGHWRTRVLKQSGNLPNSVKRKFCNFTEWGQHPCQRCGRPSNQKGYNLRPDQIT